MEKIKEEEAVWMNFKVTKELKKKIKCHVASEDITLQDFLNEAILEKLEKNSDD